MAAEVKVIDFQLLPYRVEVSVDDDRLLPVLAYLANGARQPLVPRAVMRYQVRGHGPYELFEEGDQFDTVEVAGDVLYLVYQRCHNRLLDYLTVGGWVPLHGGVASVAGRRVLVLGEKGSGKTTLMLRLLHDGHAVEGDELVLTRRGEAVCLPRNFHVKAGTRALVPELDARWDGLPTTSTSDGAVISAFDPAAAGFPWTLVRAPVDVVFVLHADHGGASACRPLTSLEAVRFALTNSFPTTVPMADVVRACSTLLGRAEAYALTVGDVTRTAAMLAAAVRSGG